MVFTVKKVQTQTLGEYLQACRHRRGLSLEEAAILSQVQPKYLAALEEGEFAVLPAPVYIRGFLKSLAKIYQIKEQELLPQFQSEHEIAENLELLGKELPKSKFVFPRFIFSPKTLTMLAASVLGLASLVYLFFQVSSLNRSPVLEIYSPLADETVDSGLMVVYGKTEPGAAVYFNNQAIVVDAQGEFRENLSLGPGVNKLVIKSVNKFGQETVAMRSIVLQEKEIAGSFAENPATASGNKLAVEVRIGPQAAWIFLEADGVEQYSGTMLPNASRIIIAKNGVILTTGNAGSTRVLLDGKDLGILGKEGEVIRDIEFTR